MKTSSGKVRKRRTTQTKRRELRGTVVKMLAVMESKPESTDPVMEFLVTGRTGRRNAMPDILGPHASVTSGDLPEKLQSLSTADADAGPSSCQEAEQEDEDKSMDHHPSLQSVSEEGNNESKSKEKDADGGLDSEDKSMDLHPPLQLLSEEGNNKINSKEKG